MGHWAKIDDTNRVVDVVVADDDKGAWLTKALGGTWVKTSYNTRGGIHYNQKTGKPSADQSKAFRKNYAGENFTYDKERDAFIPPKPFDSWVLNEETCLWESPIPYPSDGGLYRWDESLGDWMEVV